MPRIVPDGLSGDLLHIVRSLAQGDEVTPELQAIAIRAYQELTTIAWVSDKKPGCDDVGELRNSGDR